MHQIIKTSTLIKYWEQTFFIYVHIFNTYDCRWEDQLIIYLPFVRKASTSIPPLQLSLAQFGQSSHIASQSNWLEPMYHLEKRMGSKINKTMLHNRMMGAVPCICTNKLYVASFHTSYTLRWNNTKFILCSGKIICPCITKRKLWHHLRISTSQTNQTY